MSHPAAEPPVTPELVAQHGLTPEEFERIRKILGRDPNFTELGIFSVMWSEHCSYKNSRKELRKLPTSGPGILVKAGEENAGVVDIGDGWAVAFKIESHNHPSAIEPFQGAATGVGGIIRDIFTMGARPEFLLNSLRFGPIVAQASCLRSNNDRKPEARATFQGFNEFLEIDVARRRLPHWEQEGATYFVTFRLADSLPKAKLDELEDERRRWMAAHPEPWSDANKDHYYDRFSDRIEEWLDTGYGACLLRDPGVAEIVAKSLQHFDGERYQLGAWVVMPNHVHAILKPLKPHNLSQVLHGWKSYSAKAINSLLKRSGGVWQHESYDHIVRDDAARGRISDYIERNPERAGIRVAQASCLRSNKDRKPEARATLASNRRLFSGVVSGIAHYGNCIGIPTIGGEIYFDESFEGNPLVNVFCLGVLRHDQLARGAARGVGNPVFYVGAETGRDGLAGAAFASRELTDESHEDRPAVQVGDPFKEKLLLEACLELLASGAVAGIQDMGAAGLTCSTCETASRGGSGIEIDLAKVPKREPGMTPYEILLSESQERMLIIAKRGQEQVVRDVFEKWDVPCAEIGRVTDDGMMRVRNNGSIAAEIPAKPLAEEAPLYSREAVAPEATQVSSWPELLRGELGTCPVPQALRQLLRDPTIASKNWVYRQYDHTVRTGTVVKPGSDAGVFFVRYANKILAATTDCNSLYCRIDPRQGGKIAVAEAARNLACSGARPLAVTDNLNFGNPYKPENFWQLREAVEGVAEACRAFGTPVTGGNVSLYNESRAGVIDPTPTIGMVGLIDEESHVTTQWFKAAGDIILLVGPLSGSQDPARALGGSRFLKVCYGWKRGPVPDLDLEMEIKVQTAVLHLIQKGLIRSAHDCSEGGLAVNLAECCFNPESLWGAAIKVAHASSLQTNTDRKLEACAILFGEAQSRIVISVAKEDCDKVLATLRESGVPHARLGAVARDELRIRLHEEEYRWPIADLYDDWWNAIRHAIDLQESIPAL